MEKITFDNGLRIILEKIDQAKTCSMGIWVASGSRWENEETAGASHFIEHMLFKGTKSRSALDIASQIDELGGTLNAYTTKEYTCFYLRALTDHVTTAFDILADMFTNSKLDEKDISTERGVVLEELAMYEDSPEDLCSDIFYENVFCDDMIGRNILGTRENISSMTADTLIRQMNDCYVPERTVIAFCGNFDRDTVLEMCEKYFGSMKNTGNPLEFTQPCYHKSFVTCKKPFEQNHIILAFPGVSSLDERRFALSLVCTAMGGSSSSRLFQRLREELGLVYSVDAFSVPYLGTGLAGITMSLSAGSEKKALGETVKILEGFSEGLTSSELERAKNQAVALFIMGLESTSARASRAAQSELLYNRIADEDELAGKIGSVTLDEAGSVAADTFKAENMSLCCTGRVHSDDFYKKILKLV